MSSGGGGCPQRIIAPDYIITRWPALFFPVEEKRKEKKKKAGDGDDSHSSRAETALEMSITLLSGPCFAPAARMQPPYAADPVLAARCSARCHHFVDQPRRFRLRYTRLPQMT